MLLSSFSLLLLFQIVYGSSRSNPIVESNVGVIKGLQAQDGDYSMFLGIPYAKVDPDNVFGMPTTQPNFENIFEAYDDSVVCPQIEEFNHTIVGTVDCLNLNVFVPNSPISTNRLPVLVWFYGSEYSYGYASRFLYGARFLVRHDIIVVTVNYRVGPYGFMCTDSPLAPGNQGVKDQALALKWVRQNIEAFNGDPNKITAAGSSDGSSSIDLHLLSKNEKLFDQVIFQSGNILSPGIGREPIRNMPILLAEHLGLSTKDISEALRFLSNLDSHLVVEATNALNFYGTFRPCVERNFDNIKSIVTENWNEAPLQDLRNVPIMIGLNSHEIENLKFTSGTNDIFEYIIPMAVEICFDLSNPEFEGMLDIIRHFYVGDDYSRSYVADNVTNFLSDFRILNPMYRSINKYFEYGAEDIYLYQFSFVGDRNFARYKNNINATAGGGAWHTDELAYLFDMIYLADLEITPAEQKVIDQMTSMWANFVKYGNPTPQTSELLPVIWTPITQNLEKRPFMNIDSTLSLGSRPYYDRAAFWNLFYKKNGHLLTLPVLPGPAPSSSTQTSPVVISIAVPLLTLLYMMLNKNSN